MEQFMLPTLPPEKKCSRCAVSKPYSEFRRALAGKGDKHGLRSWCRECEREYKRDYRQRNKEKLAARRRLYREEHREKIAARQRQYRQDNKERIRALERQYFLTHKEQKYATNRRYAEKHREEIATYQAQYYRDHKGELDAYRVNYAQEHPEKEAEWRRAYRESHKDEIAEYNRQYREEHKEEQAEYAKRYRQEHPEGTRRRRLAHIARKKGAPGTHTADQFQALVDFYEVCLCCGEPYTEDNPVTEDHIVPLSWPGTSDSLSNVQPLCFSCNSRKGDRHATNYRDPVRELMAQPDKYGPANFMAAYWESAGVGAPQPVTLEAH